jgi:hypothetical protein
MLRFSKIPALGFRENLVNHVQILENECELVLWVKIYGKVFNLVQTNIFRTIYIPTEYTRYTLDEVFNQIDNDNLSFLYKFHNKNYK